MRLDKHAYKSCLIASKALAFHSSDIFTPRGGGAGSRQRASTVRESCRDMEISPDRRATPLLLQRASAEVKTGTTSAGQKALKRLGRLALPVGSKGASPPLKGQGDPSNAEP